MQRNEEEEGKKSTHNDPPLDPQVRLLVQPDLDRLPRLEEAEDQVLLFST